MKKGVLEQFPKLHRIIYKKLMQMHSLGNSNLFSYILSCETALQIRNQEMKNCTLRQIKFCKKKLFFEFFY